MSVHKPNHGPQWDCGSDVAKKVLDALENDTKANSRKHSWKITISEKNGGGGWGGGDLKSTWKIEMPANFNSLNPFY